MASIRLLKAARISKFLSRYNLDSSISKHADGIDLGEVLFVGSGGNLETLARGFQSNSFITVDIDADRKPDRVMSVTALDFPENNFDTVFMLEVLEHVT